MPSSNTASATSKTLLREDDGLVEYGPEAFEDPDFESRNVVMLWDDNGRAVAGGTNYHDEDDDL